MLCGCVLCGLGLGTLCPLRNGTSAGSQCSADLQKETPPHTKEVMATHALGQRGTPAQPMGWDRKVPAQEWQ